MQRKIWIAANIFSAPVLLLPAVCMAATGSGDGHVGISHLFWYAINFLLFVFIVYFLTRKPFSRFWEERRATIEAAVNKGEREMQAAKAALMEATEKVSALTPEFLAGVVSEIETGAKGEGQAIIESAKQQVGQIHQHTAQSIQAERIKSQHDVRTMVATEVIAQATARVKQSYSEEQDAERRRAALNGSSSLVQ